MVTSAPSLFEGLLSEAVGLAAKCEWEAAAELYDRALKTSVDHLDQLERTRMIELFARCYYKAAFQSPSRAEFIEKMKVARAGYEQARSIYNGPGLEPLAKMSRARRIFAEFWLSTDPSVRRKSIEDCISLAEDASRLLEPKDDMKALAEAHKDLLSYFSEARWLANEWSLVKNLYDRAVVIGEKAVREFEALGQTENLLESANMYVSFLLDPNVWEPTRHRELRAKCSVLVNRLSEISEKFGTAYALSLAKEAAGWLASFSETQYPESLGLLEKAALQAERTRDSLLIGRLYFGISNSCMWQWHLYEELEGRRSVLEKGANHALKAIDAFETPSHGAWLEWSYSDYVESCVYLATEVETKKEEKKSLLKKSIEAARRGIQYKNHLNTPQSGHSLSKALYFLSSIEENPEEKMALLREALPLEEEEVRIFDLVHPYSWARGGARHLLARIKAELSKMERDPNLKAQLLEEAVSHMDECVALCEKWATTPDLIGFLVIYEEGFGDILLQLYGLKGQPERARRAAKVYEEAIDYLTKTGQSVKTAALWWKTGKAYDLLGDYHHAVSAFRNAAENYRGGAGKVESLAQVFGELSLYMEAWSLIEEARIRHSEERYDSASENYVKAAGLLQKTKTWELLSGHYLACSFLESGEALSRQDRQDTALDSLREARKTFQKTRGQIEVRQGENVAAQERMDLRNWLEVTRGREEYCRGRIELEEARLLDRKGNQEDSSAKYRSASQAFESLLKNAPNELSRREIETLTQFCMAWTRMKEAEMSSSPELYTEAAQAFEKARETSPGKKLRDLALANASICKALEVGTRFRLTRDVTLYSDIKKHLETATDYYLQGGFENAADWTQATQRLFDALVYMSTAESEMEPKRKTEMFHLVEKHLEKAAELYVESGFPTKREEALRHLKRAKAEKELLLTPVQALAENPVTKGGTVAPVSLTTDQASGLERFEAANVVGNIGVSQRELGVGSSVTLELDMANVGKTAATLMRVENLAPDGLEIDRQRVENLVEDTCVNMKGRRLEYLKTYELKIPLRAVQKGSFELRPKVLFVDETGSYRSYEFEPARVTVTELGISGWLRGRK